MRDTAFQMEFWIPKGRKGGAWVPAHSVPVGNYRTWRKVKVGHEHADKIAHSITMRDRAGVRTKQDVMDQYCDWARKAGLPYVHVYHDDFLAISRARAAGLNFIEVDTEPFYEHVEDAP